MHRWTDPLDTFLWRRDWVSPALYRLCLFEGHHPLRPPHSSRCCSPLWLYQCGDVCGSRKLSHGKPCIIRRLHGRCLGPDGGARHPFRPFDRPAGTGGTSSDAPSQGDFHQRTHCSVNGGVDHWGSDRSGWLDENEWIPGRTISGVPGSVSVRYGSFGGQACAGNESVSSQCLCFWSVYAAHRGHSGSGAQHPLKLRCGDRNAFYGAVC